MIQTNWVAQQLRLQWPNLEVAIEQIRTTGDRVTNLSLSQIGGDGVFVTEIEHALHEHRVDLAVHSLKDLPTLQPDDLTVLVSGEREDVRDVFISREKFHIVAGVLQPLNPRPASAGSLRIGTCSLRRTAQLRALLPEVEILPLRGNVDTRIRKLDAGEYDGIILAAAGLHRLDFADRLADRLTYFPLDLLLPAPGQGALAIECRNEAGILNLLHPLQNLTAQATTSAERSFMRRLGAGCYLPVAAYAAISAESFTLTGLVISLDGQRSIRVSQSIPWGSATSFAAVEQLAIDVAEQALAQGADQIIREIAPMREQERSNV